MHHATVTHRPARRTRPHIAVAAFVMTLALAACQPGAAGSEAITDGLLILARGDSPTLDVLVARGDTESPVQVDVPLPGANATWISAGGAGILAATTADGRLFTSDPVDPGGPAADLAGLGWQRADATGGSPAFEGPGWFATWGPAGRSFAALAGDLLDGGDMRLVVVDTATPTPVEIALGSPLLPAPPTWLDADRIAVIGGTTAAPETILVEVATGETTAGPSGVRRIATSGDGKIVAASGGAGAPVIIRSTRAWLAEDGTSIGTIEVPDGYAEAITMALDADGERLAIVWIGVDGTPRYDVHDGTDGWRRVLSEEVPNAASVALAWLR